MSNKPSKTSLETSKPHPPPLLEPPASQPIISNLSPQPNEEVAVGSPFELQNFGQLLEGMQGKSHNEKVVHLSRINTIEDVKEDFKEELKEEALAALSENNKLENSFGVQVNEEITTRRILYEPESESKGVQTTFELQQEVHHFSEEIPRRVPKIKPLELKIESTEPLNKSSSLNEIELMNSDNRVEIVPEEEVKNMVVEVTETNPHELLEIYLNTPGSKSIFERSPFQDFTQSKMKEVMSGDNLSKLIRMREKVMIYKESTEKRYINRMYKAKQFSPRTYFSKKKELEKWITTEREEIKISKKSLMETWEKTAKMMDDAQQNAQHLRDLIAAHTLSYNSASNSTHSIILEFSRPDTPLVRGSAEQREEFPTDNFKMLKHDQSLDDLGDLLQSSKLGISPSSAGQPKNFKDIIDSDDDIDREFQIHSRDPSATAAPIFIQDTPISPEDDVSSPEAEKLKDNKEDLSEKKVKEPEEDAEEFDWNINLPKNSSANTRNKTDEIGSNQGVSRGECKNVIMADLDKRLVQTSPIEEDVQIAEFDIEPSIQERSDDISKLMYYPSFK